MMRPLASSRAKCAKGSGPFAHFACLVAVMLLAIALPIGAYAAETSDEAAVGAQETSQVEAAGKEGEAAAKSGRIDAAIVACISGLLEGWDVPDAASLYSSDMLDVADGTCAWIAFDAYRAGLADGSEVFLKRMEDYATQAYAGDGKGLDPYSPTSWARTAIVVHALGADPAAFGAKPNGQPANLLSDGLFNWSYTENLGDQGSNAYIYALQAIDACDAEVPDDAAYSVQDMLDGLLACQAEDGSFALSPGSATGSVDLTGMALAALGAYAHDPVVANAVEHAIAYLQAQQQPSGGFAAEGEESSESCAMVIIGLAACGIDPAADARFVKESGSVVDALLSFQKANGTFGHTTDDVANDKVQDLPTEQALRALLALEDIAQGDGNVYTAEAPLRIAGIEQIAGATAQSGEAAAGISIIDAIAASVWARRFVSLAVGAAAALVLVVAIWAVRKARRKR